MEYLGTFGKNSLIFGTWNVRGLTEKKKETFSEIERENVDVVVLTETKLKETGFEDCGKYVHYWSGVSEDDYGQAGVSILIKKDLGVIESWEAVNERIIKAEWQIYGQKITLMGVYWVNETSKKPEYDVPPRMTKDDLQQAFEEQLKNVKKERELIILGDFNSRVENFDFHLARLEKTCEKLNKIEKRHFTQDYQLKDLQEEIEEMKKMKEEHEKGIYHHPRILAVGSFGVKNNEMNDNGRRQLNICTEFKLKIQNTFFDHEDIHMYTWYEKNGSKKSVIDFCITRQETALLVHDVLACRWFECGTDHIFVAAFITIPTTDYEGKYRTYLLHSDTLRKKYENQLDIDIDKTTEGKLQSSQQLENCGMTDEMYNNFKTIIHSAAEKVLGILDNDTIGEFLWDKEIKNLREKRDSSYKFTIDSNLDEKIKNEVWKGVCLAVENTEISKRSKKAWSILHEMLNNNNDNIIDQKTLEDFWKRNEIDIRDLESRKINRYTIDPTKTIQIKVEDVTKALEQLDDDAWPVPGGLSIQLLKKSSSKTKSFLTNLIQKVFNGEEIPPEISETYIKLNTTNDIDLHVHSIMRIMCYILKGKLETEISEGNHHSILLQTTNLDTTFMLRIYLQKIAEKNIKSSHIAFLDLKQVYFGVQYEKLFNILEEYGISKKFLAVLEHLFKSNTIRGIETNKQSILSKGLIEQNILGPILFKIYIQESINEWQKENQCAGNVFSSSMIYGDKIIVIARSSRYLKEMIQGLKIRLQTLGLNIGLENLKYLGFKSLIFDNITINGQSVIEFDGSSFELKGRNLKEVSDRIIETKNAIAYLHPALRDEDIYMTNKKRIFETIITHIFLNGCETWTWDKTVKELMIKNPLERNYQKWCFENCLEDSKVQLPNESFYNLSLLRKKEWYSKKKWNILKWNPGGTNRRQRPAKQWMDDIDELEKNKSNSELL